MKDNCYFSHDANALTDPKILSMRCDYGMEGYGIFWAIIEMLRTQEDYTLELNKLNFNALKMLCMTQIDIQEFINKCINEYKLFETDGEYFWSDSLCKRMAKKDTISQRRRESSNKRWEKEKNKLSENTKEEQDGYKNDTNEKEDTRESRNKSKCNANAMQNDAKESKEKEIKEKESKENKEKESKGSGGTAAAENRILKFYTQNIQAMPSATQIDKICSWTDVMSEELVIKAMEIAVDANVRRYDYIRGILNRFQESGFKTTEDYNNAENIRKSRQKQVHEGKTGNVFFDMLGGGGDFNDAG